MNRLILIGNGFDLSHGLKTTYKHFIEWYMQYCFKEAYSRMTYYDPLIQIHRTNRYLKNVDDLPNWVHGYLTNFVTNQRKEEFGWPDVNIIKNRNP